ncbi:MAG: YceI family protein [Chloroflexi bacterium]|nr:YceI family protein [Chloroflexota bacterium]
MSRKLSVVLLVCVSLIPILVLLAGCTPAAAPEPAAPEGAPSPASEAAVDAATPTVAPTTGPATAETGTTAPSGAAPSPPASPTAPAGTASRSADQPAANGTILFTLVSGGSEARYKVREQLAGRALPGEAIGVTRGVTGSIALAPDGSIAREQSRIVVDLRGLRSDEGRRDNWIQRNTLETARFPLAEFIPLETRGLPLPLPAAGQVEFQILGNLTVRGVTQPVTWDFSVQVTGGDVSGTAATRLKMTDFNMTPPRVGPVLSIEDAVQLEIDFRATRGAGPAAELVGTRRNSWELRYAHPPVRHAEPQRSISPAQARNS